MGAQYRQCIEAVFVDYVHSGAWPNEAGVLAGGASQTVPSSQPQLDALIRRLYAWPMIEKLKGQ